MVIKKVSHVGWALAGLAAQAHGQCEIDKLFGAGVGVGSRFGTSVSTSGDLALIGAPGGPGAFLFAPTASGWVEIDRLTSCDYDPLDAFGYSVSLTEERLIVGAYRNDDAGDSSGSAYVFEWTGMEWREQKLVASDAREQDRFGWSVSLSGDTALIGAPEASSSLGERGAVYFFENVGGGWLEGDRVTASDLATADGFGLSVFIEGDRAIVGAPRSDSIPFNSGAAYVLERAGSRWMEVARLVPADLANGDLFGFSVALAGDTAFVGAIQDDGSGTDSGACYVFERTGSGWMESTKLLGSGLSGGERFGWSVASAEESVLIGAPFQEESGTEVGAAYAFRRVAAGWEEYARLGIGDAAEDYHLGHSVALFEETAVVGIPEREGSGLGFSAVFVLTGGRSENFCTSTPNSTGAAGRIGISGSLSIGSGDTELLATHCPPLQWGLYCYGPEQKQIPFGDGFLCLGPGAVGLFRLFPPVAVGDSGAVNLPLDFSGPPLGSGRGRVLPGSTWNFQFWFRDPVGPGGTGFNLTDAIEATFCP